MRPPADATLVIPNNSTHKATFFAIDVAYELIEEP
jgi:hypothetical protein